MLTTFRMIAVLEGFSYLALFGFSMPLKYWAGLPEYNIYIGYAHGFLFMAYLTMAIVMFVDRSWSRNTLIKLLLASVLPFGTFYLDQYFLKPISISEKAING